MASNKTRIQDAQQAYLTVLNFLKRAFQKGARKVNAREWDSFQEELEHSKLSPEAATVVGFWTMENLASHKPSRVQPRALQEFEAQIFPGAVHSEFVEAVQFGMVSEIQGESILEDFLEISSFEIPKERMLKSLSQMWAKNVQGYQMVRVS